GVGAHLGARLGVGAGGVDVLGMGDGRSRGAKGEGEQGRMTRPAERIHDAAAPFVGVGPVSIRDSTTLCGLVSKDAGCLNQAPGSTISPRRRADKSRMSFQTSPLACG